jgi:hypothetical protein
MPGRTLWGGPSQAGGLTAMARWTSAVEGAGGSKKLIAAWYAAWSALHSGGSAGVSERQGARHSGASHPSMT